MNMIPGLWKYAFSILGGILVFLFAIDLLYEERAQLRKVFKDKRVTVNFFIAVLIILIVLNEVIVKTLDLIDLMKGVV